MDYTHIYRDAELTNLSLYKENKSYYLKATYHCKELDEEFDLIFPKILLQLPRHPMVEIERETNKDVLLYENAFLKGSLDDAELNFKIYPDDDYHSCYVIRNIVENVEEVTMKDVEKKFGHKVRIVEEKSE